ncbi:hypothetical protein CO083_03500 [Candidatus Roizmanbacteria bacterium CG_4_9_14_0_8_um_filter_34_12]|uniref:HTH cro/C1-type domain-containing protein n=1 Tax=Candidatus Roizmanbacteria bacterium CG_4_9_14_0_8_um_filter_34_12 TaxID=1974840 RepID=A0A2M8DCL4_9BACT|nr:MAG: hypothetical protein CO083_03500 [Candidatus Roizmanbacteria bacterium CG_4_9_14_0_8_um_filter_34_12]
MTRFSHIKFDISFCGYYNSIIKLETGGITNPTIETLQKIAKALDVSVDELIK